MRAPSCNGCPRMIIYLDRGEAMGVVTETKLTKSIRPPRPKCTVSPKGKGIIYTNRNGCPCVAAYLNR